LATEIFLQDTPLAPVADALVPYLCYVLEATGHRALRTAGTHAVVVDSPLEGRLFRLEPLGERNDTNDRFIGALKKRLHMAGGIVTERARDRAEVTLLVRAEPCEPDDRPRVLLWGHRRGWFTRRPSLADSVGEKLRMGLRVPVGVTWRRFMRKQELHMYVSAAEEAYPAVATAVWLGLMACFRRGPAVPAPPLDLDLLVSMARPDGLPTTPAAQPISSPVGAPPGPVEAPSTDGPPGVAPAAPSVTVPAEAEPAARRVEAPHHPATAPTSFADPGSATFSPPSPQERLTGSVMQKIPFHEALAGTIIWSSGGASPGGSDPPKGAGPFPPALEFRPAPAAQIAAATTWGQQSPPSTAAETPSTATWFTSSPPRS